MSGDLLADLSARAARMRSLVTTALSSRGASESGVRESLGALSRELTEIEAVLQPSQHARISLADYQRSIDRFNAGQPNAPLLDAIRNYNHQIVNALHSARSLAGAAVLDVGASPHGYALERALELGARRYVGIGLDIDEPLIVSGPSGVGELIKGDAEQLAFEDGSFELLVSMSTFEHILHVDRALAEMHRVLKPKGCVLLSFEPMWTCSYGHHLHHFGEVSRLVPDWAHLMWSRDEMREALATRWPADAPLTLDAAVSWIYDSDALNRLGIRATLQALRGSALAVEWIHSLMDEPRDKEQLARAITATGLTGDELMTKGFSALLRRPA
jgi:SAM-dependent methyltransferase